MDTAQKSWVAYFHLVDPLTLAVTSNISKATVLIVSARLKNTINRVLSKSGAERYRNIGEDLLELEHRHDNHKALVERATDTNVQHFYYCARCGEKLAPERCTRCRITFRAQRPRQLVARMAPPVIPPRIAGYAESQRGSKFEFVLRPREL